MEFPDSKDRKDLIEKRRRAIWVRLALQRARRAGIPDKLQRIQRDEFRKLLDPEYHTGNAIDDIVSLVYGSRKDLFRIPFIAIDGGDENARKAAGCAILFRMIFHDFPVVMKPCGELVHKFAAFDYAATESRNELTDTLKRIGGLFISEFYRTLFKGYLQEGEFVDEILEDRENHELPTIISFTQTIVSSEGIQDLNCGQHIAKLSAMQILTPNPSDVCLRIRVRI